MTIEHEAEGTPPEENGSGPLKGGGEYHANQVKAFLSRDGDAGYFNVPRTFLEGDDNPLNYLARTEITESEIGHLARRVGDMNSLTKGHTDLPMIWAVKYTAKMSLDRKSRKEVVAIETGRRDMMMARGGFVDKLKGLAPEGSDKLNNKAG